MAPSDPSGSQDPLKAPIVKAKETVTSTAAQAVDAGRTGAAKAIEATGVTPPASLRTSDDLELGRWKQAFNAAAQTDSDGTKYLDETGFVKALVPKGDFGKIGHRQYAVLCGSSACAYTDDDRFRVADASRKGRVTLDEFIAFESLLKRPDADYLVAWKIFDIDNDGTISFDE